MTHHFFDEILFSTIIEGKKNIEVENEAFSSQKSLIDTKNCSETKQITSSNWTKMVKVNNEISCSQLIQIP